MMSVTLSLHARANTVRMSRKSQIVSAHVPRLKLRFSRRKVKTRKLYSFLRVVTISCALSCFMVLRYEQIGEGCLISVELVEFVRKTPSLLWWHFCLWPLGFLPVSNRSSVSTSIYYFNMCYRFEIFQECYSNLEFVMLLSSIRLEFHDELRRKGWETYKSQQSQRYLANAEPCTKLCREVGNVSMYIWVGFGARKQNCDCRTKISSICRSYEGRTDGRWLCSEEWTTLLFGQ